MTALDTKALLVGVTPGPWAVTGDGRYIWTADGSDYVCDIKLAEDDPEVIANARLIAEAPRLARRVIELEEALRPFAELAGGDVNMNDPLRKWITVGQLWEARAALKGEGDE